MCLDHVAFTTWWGDWRFTPTTQPTANHDLHHCFHVWFPCPHPSVAPPLQQRTKEKFQTCDTLIGEGGGPLSIFRSAEVSTTLRQSLGHHCLSFNQRCYGWFARGYDWGKPQNPKPLEHLQNVNFTWSWGSLAKPRHEVCICELSSTWSLKGQHLLRGCGHSSCNLLRCFFLRDIQVLEGFC